MRAHLAAFSAGIAAGTWLLHPLATAIIATALAACCVLAHQCVPATARISLRLLAAFLLGLGWHGLWAHASLGQRLPADFPDSTLLVAGTLVSIPEQQALASRFRFRVSDGPLSGKTLLLRDYSDRVLRAGERWRLPLRLRRPRGLANPGGFDYEAWLLAQGIDGLGYVRQEQGAERLAAYSFGSASLRQYLLDKLQRLTGQNEMGARVLPALLLGHRALLDDEFQHQLQQTGTNHLFVISGIHIGLVSALVYSLTRFLLRWIIPLIPHRPIQGTAARAAIMAALLYSLLAGFSLPTQRALVMITVFMAGRLMGRRVNLLFRFLLALAVVLLLNPLAVSGAGFWLSFMAVGGLITFADNDDRSRWRALLKAQGVVYVILLLPLLFWMGQVSLIAPLINILAIPLLGFLILPLAFAGLLVGLLWQGPGSVLLLLASGLLEWLMLLLAEAGQWLPMYAAPLAGFQGLQLIVVLGLASLGVTLMLLPLAWQLRSLALPLLLPLLLGPPPIEDDGSLRVHVLDVGQGLAVLMTRAGQAILYDTGARIEGGSDMAASVVLPFLRGLNIDRLALLVISHGDNDHAGGLPTLRQALPIDRLLTSDPAGGEADQCHAGQQFTVAGLQFRVLHPARRYRENNNNSCVLQLRFGEHRLLLSGDITRAVEYELVRQQGEALASQLLLVPHHGSATSSSFPFVKTVKPQWAVFSAGCNNSFGHPAAAVDRRYTLLGASTLNTADSGLISFTLDGSGSAIEPRLYRREQRRYWRSQNGADCR